MATKPLSKTFRRLVKVYGIGELVMTLDVDGISFNAPGKPKKVHITWPEIVAHTQTPETVKSFHAGKPVEFLKAQIAAHEAAKVKNLEKRIKNEINERSQN